MKFRRHRLEKPTRSFTSWENGQQLPQKKPLTGCRRRSNVGVMMMAVVMREVTVVGQGRRGRRGLVVVGGSGRARPLGLGQPAPVVGPSLPQPGVVVVAGSAVARLAGGAGVVPVGGAGGRELVQCAREVAGAGGGAGVEIGEYGAFGVGRRSLVILIPERRGEVSLDQRSS